MTNQPTSERRRGETITTRGGIDVEVFRQGSGPPLVWLHGLVGVLDDEPVLDGLSDHYTVYAPIWPGFGPLENEGSIEDMLDFALLGWDIVDALDLSERPVVVGHSFGAMIAAEMACLARNDLSRLVLVAPFGLWLDDHPIPDPFAVLPFELTELLLSDPSNAGKLLRTGVDISSDEGLSQFMVSNSRRLGTAGKIMFPIPNRRLSKRLYRIGVPTLIVMAADDRLVTTPYGAAWSAAIPHAEHRVIDGSGHLVNVEAPDALIEIIG